MTWFTSLNEYFTLVDLSLHVAFNRRKPIGNLIAHFIKAIYLHDFCLYMDNKPLAGGRLLPNIC